MSEEEKLKVKQMNRRTIDEELYRLYERIECHLFLKDATGDIHTLRPPRLIEPIGFHQLTESTKEGKFNIITEYKGKCILIVSDTLRGVIDSTIYRIEEGMSQSTGYSFAYKNNKVTKNEQ